MSGGSPDDPLKSLGERIEAARDARKPKPPPPKGKFDAAGFGWRMTIDLVTGVLVGAGLGWGIDSLFGSRPLFLIVMTLLGFAAGVRVMMKSAAEYQKDHPAPGAGEERRGSGDGDGT